MISGGFLRTRVARRILGLFILCALLPASLLALISYERVRTNLILAGRSRLQEQSRAEGMLMLDRLSVSNSELGLLLESIEAGGSPRAPVRFRSLTLTRSGHADRQLWGAPSVHPQLTAKQVGHLLSDHTVLLTTDDSAGARLLLVRTVDSAAGTRLWAELAPAPFWSGARPGDESATGSAICVITAANRPVRCPGALPLPSAPSGGRWGAGSIEWRDGSVPMLGGFHPLFLGYEYAAPDWIILASEPESAVLAPLADYRLTFVLVMLLSVTVVFAASHIQIRRSLTPVEQLYAGTQRVEQHDFSDPVLVTSGDEFEDLARAFNGMASTLGRQLTELTAINEIDRIVLSTPALEPVLNTIVSQLGLMGRCDAVALGVLWENTGDMWRLSASNGASPVQTNILLAPGELTELEANPVSLLINAERKWRTYLPGSVFVPDSLAGVRVFPFITRGRAWGFVALGWKQAASLGMEEAALARQMVDRVAVALSSSRLFEDLDRLSWETTRAFGRTVDAKSSWTAGHSERVTALALQLGTALGLEADELVHLHRGGLLHDIGKIGVPSAILNKAGALTTEEMDIMMTHPAIGASILAPIVSFREIIPVVLSHHEKYDGTGYPERLAGEAIPFLARILAVADVYDALTSDRPYRPGWSSAKAANLISEGAGRHFDPRVVAVFLGWHTATHPEIWDAKTPVGELVAS